MEFDEVYFTILVNSERFWSLQFPSYQKHIDFRRSSFEIFSKFMFLLCFAKIGTVVAVSRFFLNCYFYKKNIFFENSKMSCHINLGQKTAKWWLFRFVAFFMKQSLFSAGKYLLHMTKAHRIILFGHTFIRNFL